MTHGKPVTSRPNIVVFMADDHGRWALPCYGESELCTPSLDWLAAEGACMKNAYTPSPVCSPARASFWTGQLPSMHGIHDYLQEPGRNEHPGINDQITLAQRLNALGYATALCGKWHCGGYQRKQPGFGVWFTQGAGTNARFGPQPFVEGDGKRIMLHGHQAHFITDRAIRFLRSHGDAEDTSSGRPRSGEMRAPFFLFVGYTDTHTPHTGSPERLVARYRECTFRGIPDEQPSPAHGTVRFQMAQEPERRREELAQYFAAISLVDEQIGLVLDELDSQGILDETIVIYTSDHGHMNGHHGLHTKGNATVPQNFLDESIQVPCLWRWRGCIEAGVKLDAMVDHCDLHATILEAAGGDRAQTGPGASYLAMLQGRKQSWRDAQFCEYGNARMIRTWQWKYIKRYAGPNGVFADELYDLLNDPRERINLAGEKTHSVQITQLRSRLEEHFSKFEEPSRRGTDIATQPRCNDWEPWRISPAML